MGRQKFGPVLKADPKCRHSRLRCWLFESAAEAGDTPPERIQTTSNLVDDILTTVDDRGSCPLCDFRRSTRSGFQFFARPFCGAFQRFSCGLHAISGHSNFLLCPRFPGVSTLVVCQCVFCSRKRTFQSGRPGHRTIFDTRRQSLQICSCVSQHTSSRWLRIRGVDSKKCGRLTNAVTGTQPITCLEVPIAFRHMIPRFVT